MSKTPSETLRSAAKLMRERASAATPGPWEYVNDFDITHGYEINEHGRAQANWIATVDAGDDELDEAGMLPLNAAYIASMHPAVALAVADWLENEARAAEAIPGDSPVLGPLIRHALATARAYLGTGES